MTASGTVFDRTAILDFAQSDGSDSLESINTMKIASQVCTLRVVTTQLIDLGATFVTSLQKPRLSSPL